MINGIRSVDLTKIDKRSFSIHLADCVIVTHDNKILMQRRPSNWGKFSGCLNIFGGHVENNESIQDALIREIHEETGGIMKSVEIISIGAITEEFTNHTELVHIHFWHDRDATITGCYECDAETYNSVSDVLAEHKLMEYARWALIECQKKGLVR